MENKEEVLHSIHKREITELLKKTIGGEESKSENLPNKTKV